GAAQIALGAYSVYRAYDQGGIHAVGQSLMMGFLSGLGGGYNPASMGEGIAHGVVSGLINNAGTGGSGWDAVASIGVGAFGGGFEGSTNATAFRKTQASLLEDHNMRISYPEYNFLPEVHISVMRNGVPKWWGNDSFLNPIANAVRSGTAAMAPYVMAIMPIPGIPGLGGAIGKGLGKIGGRALGRVAAKTGANLSTNGANLSKHLGQLEKYGQGGFKELQNGSFRYYGNIKSATKVGEMQGARLVREWNPVNGNTRTWYETLDHAGKIRQVHPKYNNLPHYKFDVGGKYIGKW